MLLFVLSKKCAEFKSIFYLTKYKNGGIIIKLSNGSGKKLEKRMFLDFGKLSLQKFFERFEKTLDKTV